MPTDALRDFRDTMLETREYGFERLKEAQWELGNAVRADLTAVYGLPRGQVGSMPACELCVFLVSEIV